VSVLTELRVFLGKRKKFWLLPMVSMILLFLLLMMLTWESKEAFVYTLY
jgi:hypothetical protein